MWNFVRLIEDGGKKNRNPTPWKRVLNKYWRIESGLRSCISESGVQFGATEQTRHHGGKITILFGVFNPLINHKYCFPIAFYDETEE